jgi:hypothetical protein
VMVGLERTFYSCARFAVSDEVLSRQASTHMFLIPKVLIDTPCFL